MKALLFDLKLFSSNKEYLLNDIFDRVNNSSKISYIFTPNPEQIVLSRGKSSSSVQFLNDLQAADILIPDGIGLVWASWFLHRVGKCNTYIQERIAGVDIVLELCKRLVSKKYVIIGGRDYTQTDIAAFCAEYNLPTATIRWIEGFVDVTKPTNQENQVLQEYIADYKPDVIFVAFGAPYQERWLMKNKAMLQKNGVQLGMAVGGSFDYLFKKVPRAPKWLQHLGGEWAFRLLRQPWRWRRQLRLLSFLFLVFRVYSK